MTITDESFGIILKWNGCFGSDSNLEDYDHYSGKYYPCPNSTSGFYMNSLQYVRLNNNNKVDLKNIRLFKRNIEILKQWNGGYIENSNIEVLKEIKVKDKTIKVWDYDYSCGVYWIGTEKRYRIRKDLR